MPYEVQWLVENRVIYQRLYGHLILEELREAGQRVSEHVLAGTPLVHMVSDFTHVDKFPMNLREVNSMLENPYPERFGWMIGITSNTLIRFFGTVVPQLQGARIRMFTSPEEALAFLQSMDDSLPVLDTSIFKKTTG
jgi:hypothetical protein